MNPMANPMGMIDMMKGQAYFGITQMAMMQFSEMFFSGFVLGKSLTIPAITAFISLSLVRSYN